ncbi:LysR family transcriptional regulator [Myxococcus sp. CA018]|uniref:LysR family transcriptional regulator n=1 Tax=Myxococcus sp. CA018 TaxID=2651864 RepID=UPI001143E514|nr:LysR family transcriptional regulator [Myxococcus sp. CA018]NOK04520.1 LysR family transcriptional regulator [Myxococcus xanthus]
MDFDGVRTFIAVADTGQFQEAASRLSLTQQAVSKRIAALEASLGARLFVRTPRGVQLTIDGQVFLPHARRLLETAERAADSVRPGRRRLRVDVVKPNLGSARILRDFHSAHPEIEIDIVTHLFDAKTALAAVRAGTIDATFRAITRPAQQLTDGVVATRVLDDAVELLTSHTHRLATATSLTPAELAKHKVWMPFIVPGTEWAAYYDELAARFGLTIDTLGPDFGIDALLEVIAGSSSLATLVGEHIRLVWPAEYNLRRIPIRNPMLVYPHSLVWRSDNAHPALTKLRAYLDARKDRYRHPKAWSPPWTNR